MITNGEFVDNMLDQIRTLGKHPDWTQQVLDHLKAYYTTLRGKFLSLSPQTQGLIRKIDHRVAEMYHTIDPMWFVVALHHRNQGGFWRDMQRYGIRRNESSYKVEKASRPKYNVYTKKYEPDDFPTK